MKELEAKSFVARMVWGLGIGCVALASGACGSDPMPTPTGGNGDQLPNDDENGGEICGGIVGFLCPEGKYCDFESNLESSCGRGDMLGKCRRMPTSCEEECSTKVCGCDGMNYCSACLAHFAGVDDTLDLTTCVTPPTTPPPPPPTHN